MLTVKVRVKFGADAGLQPLHVASAIDQLVAIRFSLASDFPADPWFMLSFLVVVTTAGRNPAVSSISESINPVDPLKPHAALAEGVVLAYVGPLVVVTTAGRKPSVSSQAGQQFFVKQDEAGSSL